MPSTTMKRGIFLERPAVRFVALGGLWLLSGLLYYTVFIRPYRLSTYLLTPLLSLGGIAQQQPGPAAIFVVGFLLLFALYALAYRASKNWPSATAAILVVLGGLILSLLLMQVYPIGANDVFSYIGDGELLAFHGLNPVMHTPSEVSGLPWSSYIAYSQTVSTYGPVWSWIEAGVVSAVGQSDLAALVISFKAVAILAYLVAGFLIAALLRQRSPDRLVAGLLAFAWNPLVLFEVAVNAHNDIWVGTLVLAGVLWRKMRWPIWTLAALTLALLIKVPVAPLLPLFALAAWRLAPPHERRRLVVGASLVVIGLVFVAYLSQPEGLASTTNVQRWSNWFTNSPAAVVRLALGLAFPGDVATTVVRIALLGVFTSYFCLQLRGIYRNPTDVVRRGFNTLVFLLLVCLPWFQPWYLMWILPLAAIYPRPNTPFQAALSTLCVTWTYVVFGFVWFWIYRIGNWGNCLGINLIALLTTYALPWIYALLSTRRHKRHTERSSMGPSA